MPGSMRAAGAVSVVRSRASASAVSRRRCSTARTGSCSARHQRTVGGVRHRPQAVARSHHRGRAPDVGGWRARRPPALPWATSRTTLISAGTKALIVLRGQLSWNVPWIEPRSTGGHRRHKSRTEDPGRTPDGRPRSRLRPASGGGAAGSDPVENSNVMSRDTVHRCLGTSFTAGPGVGSPRWGPAAVRAAAFRRC
jgi:hypothetical protein